MLPAGSTPSSYCTYLQGHLSLHVQPFYGILAQIVHMFKPLVRIAYWTGLNHVDHGWVLFFLTGTSLRKLFNFP